MHHNITKTMIRISSSRLNRYYFSSSSSLYCCCCFCYFSLRKQQQLCSSFFINYKITRIITSHRSRSIYIGMNIRSCLANRVCACACACCVCVCWFKCSHSDRVVVFLFFSCCAIWRCMSIIIKTCNIQFC